MHSLVDSYKKSSVHGHESLKAF